MGIRGACFEKGFRSATTLPCALRAGGEALPERCQHSES